MRYFSEEQKKYIVQVENKDISNTLSIWSPKWRKLFVISIIIYRKEKYVQMRKSPNIGHGSLIYTNTIIFLISILPHRIMDMDIQDGLFPFSHMNTRLGQNLGP